MKRIFPILCLLVLLCGCQPYSKLAVDSPKLDGYRLESLRAINLTVSATVINPGKEFSMQDGFAEVIFEGSPCLDITCDGPVLIPSGTNRMRLDVRGTIPPESSYRKVLDLASVQNLDDIRLNVRFGWSFPGGKVRRKEYKNLPASMFVK